MSALVLLENKIKNREIAMPAKNKYSNNRVTGNDNSDNANGNYCIIKRKETRPLTV